MPIYEYACNSCSHVTSAFIRRGDAPASVVCEHCGATDTHKVISAIAVRLGPLNENKGKPSEEAQQHAKDQVMRDAADSVIRKTLKDMGR